MLMPRAAAPLPSHQAWLRDHHQQAPPWPHASDRTPGASTCNMKQQQAHHTERDTLLEITGMHQTVAAGAAGAARSALSKLGHRGRRLFTVRGAMQSLSEEGHSSSSCANTAVLWPEKHGGLQYGCLPNAEQTCHVLAEAWPVDNPPAACMHNRRCGWLRQQLLAWAHAATAQPSSTHTCLALTSRTRHLHMDLNETPVPATSTACTTLERNEAHEPRADTGPALLLSPIIPVQSRSLTTTYDLSLPP